MPPTSNPDLEAFEHAMDALFHSLPSTAHAVRAGLVRDPRPVHCPRCGRDPLPGRTWCDCGRKWGALR